MSSDDATFDWSPSEVAAEERRLDRDLDGAPPRGDPTGPTTGEEAQWQCLSCHSAAWRWDDEKGYTCPTCGGCEYFNVSQPTKLETPTGTWMYVPHGPDSVASGSGDASSSPTPVNRRSGFGGPKLFHGYPPGDAHGGGSERAESEAPTFDPIVNPDEPIPGGRRRRRRGGSQVSEPADALHGPVLPDAAVQRDDPAELYQRHGHGDDMLDVMRQLLHEKRSTAKTGSEASWNSMRGPAPGVRWRGGAPPLPPKWIYQQSDLRAFAKYERKVRTWELQAKSFMTAAEMGLALYTSLQGEAEAEAEAEAEHLELSKINHKNGVSYILDQLRGPCNRRYSSRRENSWLTSRALDATMPKPSDSMSIGIAESNETCKPLA